jgi:hypothetical protein
LQLPPKFNAFASSIIRFDHKRANELSRALEKDMFSIIPFFVFQTRKLIQNLKKRLPMTKKTPVSFVTTAEVSCYAMFQDVAEFFIFIAQTFRYEFLCGFGKKLCFEFSLM